jgi:FKBP-type peptidyl-prolyl cis-trans isomerase (trigger factor)
MQPKRATLLTDIYDAHGRKLLGKSGDKVNIKTEDHYPCIIVIGKDEPFTVTINEIKIHEPKNIHA